MRKYIIYIASFIGSALLQTSCYDDKGDYDYHDVNMMEIVIPEIKLRMPKEEAVEVSIVPQISQTLEQNEENLVFQWKRLKPDVTLGSSRLSDYTDYSEGKECTITVEPNESQNIGLMLVVSDKRNGTAWYQRSTLVGLSFKRKKIKGCLELLKVHRKGIMYLQMYSVRRQERCFL